MKSEDLVDDQFFDSWISPVLPVIFASAKVVKANLDVIFYGADPDVLSNSNSRRLIDGQLGKN